MATNRRKAPKPPYGKRLEDRRKQLRKSYDRIEEETNGRLYKQWWYRLENGRKKPESLTPDELDEMAKVLDWTPAQVAEALGITLPASMSLEGMDAFREQYGAHLGDWQIFPVYNTATAGKRKPEIVDDEEVAIPKQVLRDLNVDPSKVMPIKVNGNCLVSQKLRFSTRNIAHGDYAFVELGRSPQPGDRVLYFDEKDEKLILKLWREVEDDYIVVYDAHGISFGRPAEEPDLFYRGVVFWRSGGV